MNKEDLEHIVKKITPGYWPSIDVGPGWYKIVFDCDRELTEIDPNYTVQQIKEKYGGLRYYFSPSVREVAKNRYWKMNDVVTKYEDLASRTCEETGGPGVLMVSGGWYKTLNVEYAMTTLKHLAYEIVK